jgi:hypothetical protein
MNTVAGRIVVKESGVGIPDLIVVLFDVDPTSAREELIPGAEAPPMERVERAERSPGVDRLASVLTDANGAFEVTFDDAEFRIGTPEERRPDLDLLVLAPEEPRKKFEERILYSSVGIRQNAGRVETYIIRLDADLLREYEIAVPNGAAFQAEPVEGIGERLRATETWKSDVVDASVEAARVRVDQHRARFAPFKKDVAPALRTALSSVPESHQPERFVAPGESVVEKNRQVIDSNLKDVVNDAEVRKRTPVRGLVTLTDDEVEQLKDAVDADGRVPEEALARVKARTAPTRDTFVERSSPAALCRTRASRPRTWDAVLADDPPSDDDDAAAAGQGGGGAPVVTGANVDPVTAGDVPRYMARVMETMTAPEEELEAGLMPSATRQTIGRNIRRLAFAPSPADVPALHDFHQLHIAFQHVWQEAIDEGLVQLAEDAYQTIVELGGTPEGMAPRGENALGGILAEGHATLAAARVVRDHRTGSPASGAPGGVVVTPSPGGRDHRTGAGPNIRDHRTPGGGGPGTPQTDPIDRLPSLLVELRKRLQGTYAFTTYAANRKERSVNFGILNTYRQTWKPLAYQAGPLVKSIPLAPKQTQKLTITRKVHRKRSLRELENNLRSVREELSETSRAEEEIARRASSKTAFSMSNTATGGVEGIGSDSHTVAFSHEASKSSDDVKKSFREAVFKAAQEVRQERTTEVTSEESEDLETVEVTEITNPNDEIAVTFLLYELQRRFRVSERLHRVRPVVLVAQEMPAPHEIDIDWLVTHDWVLKRAILDDSFLPALSYLTQTAGDETAVAELRVNVEQQRAIVEQLREEVAAARRATAAPAALLEQSVLRKAVPSERGGGDGLFGLVGDIAGEVANLGSGVLESVGDLVFGDSPAAPSNREAMEDVAQRAADRARDLMFRLEREVTALNALMESYAKRVREYHDRLTEIARLQVHVLENILYYMQAIWTYEPPDQRYFRLHTVPVPTFKPTRRRFAIDFDEPVSASVTPPHVALPRFGGRSAKAFPSISETTLETEVATAPLAEVADLDTMLGFKGNCMIFPLLESNALTDFMMDPYVDRATGELIDPSDPSPMTLDEFVDYVRCLKTTLKPKEFALIEDDLRRQHEELLTSPRRSDDVLVVPTSSLFIEALPAGETLLEPYKKIHRLEDAKRAQEDVRGMQMESIRKMARLLAGEREDPNIDKRVSIEGDAGVVVDDG